MFKGKHPLPYLSEMAFEKHDLVLHSGLPESISEAYKSLEAAYIGRVSVRAHDREVVIHSPRAQIFALAMLVSSSSPATSR